MPRHVKDWGALARCALPQLPLLTCGPCIWPQAVHFTPDCQQLFQFLVQLAPTASGLHTKEPHEQWLPRR